MQEYASAFVLRIQFKASTLLDLREKRLLRVGVAKLGPEYYVRGCVSFANFVSEHVEVQRVSLCCRTQDDTKLMSDK